ncbi:hypothetical protein [Amycolatopsis sp.]|uniref:hypothetical protein n=1 Tax=Amycolatopsis sp. TaxID=37632 RepID=UPI002B973002|nr:hypothetical protein [Amycolatopsis sp.]HVV12851.1 hypothetical protein [Amycolatopsis sp.]
MGESLRIALATGQIRRPLHETLRPMLAALAEGGYELSGPAPLYDDRQLVASRDWPDAEAGRVAYYRRGVRSGLRPVAVLLCGPDGDLVLDGHHKIVAYQAERLAPAVIRIVPVNRGCDPKAPPAAGRHRPTARR